MLVFSKRAARYRSRLSPISFSVLMATLTFLNCSRRQERSKEERKEESQRYYSHIMLMSGLSPPPPPVDRPRPSPFFSHYPPPVEEKKGEMWGRRGNKEDQDLFNQVPQLCYSTRKSTYAGFSCSTSASTEESQKTL